MTIKKPARLKRHTATNPPFSECPIKALVRRLEVLSGCELQHGHHARAEQLAHRAPELRQVAP